MKIIGRLPVGLYKKIQASTPVVCVDLVVADRQKHAFLLVKRVNEPEKGKWFLPGGRVFKNEKLAQAALRKLREETGLKGKVMRELGVGEYFSKRGYFRGSTSHTVSAVYLIEVAGRKNAVLDPQSSEARWFNGINSSWHPYVKRFLRLAGFK